MLYGECLSDALYWNDFLNFAKIAGFTDPRLVTHRPITIENSVLEAAVAPLKFTSASYRLWKLADLESNCENYGQSVIYKRRIENCRFGLPLDGHHWIETGKVLPVCGNTWNMLAQTRFVAHFDFIGNFDKHYGIFEGYGAASPFEADAAEASCC